MKLFRYKSKNIIVNVLLNILMLLGPKSKGSSATTSKRGAENRRGSTGNQKTSPKKF